MDDEPKVRQFEELSDSEKSALEDIYGRQPRSESDYTRNRILAVRELTRGEQKYFAHKTFMSATFITQILFKLKGNLVPLKFNRALYRLAERMDSLRTNYCPVNNQMVAVIFSQSRDLPHTVYRNLANLDADEINDTLNKIIEADMRQSFDLTYGNLIRFAIYRTGSDEYAVLVTATHFALELFRVRIFFAEVMGVTIPSNCIATLPVRTSVNPIMEEAMRNYWVAVLSDLPAKPRLPYINDGKNNTYRQQVTRMTIPGALMSDLRKLSKSNKIMLMSLFCTAWGFMLQANNDVQDVVFCTLVQNRLDGSVNTLPVRLKCDRKMTVEHIVSGEFKRAVVSGPYSVLSWDSLQQVMKPRKNDMFNHFLSFYDFMEKTVQYSEVQAQPYGEYVLQNSWDAEGPKLALYFHYADAKVTINFIYNANLFLPQMGEQLAKLYLSVLQQMVSDWSATWAAFMDHLKGRVLATDFSSREEERLRIKSIVEHIELAQGLSYDTLKNIAGQSALLKLYEGDWIREDVLRDNLVFIGEGCVARSIETGDGWYNTLDILKAGSWVNETVLLKEQENNISAVVLTDRADVLIVPIAKWQKLVNLSPELMANVTEYVLKRMEKYQRLWIKS